MYLKAQIETTGQSVLSLPEEAVISFEDKNYIFTPDASQVNHFKMQEVSMGMRDNGYVEVILPEGLNKQTTIVVKGTFNLLSKLKNSVPEE